MIPKALEMVYDLSIWILGCNLKNPEKQNLINVVMEFVSMLLNSCTPTDLIKIVTQKDKFMKFVIPLIYSQNSNQQMFL
jgi:hypothetical protein